MFIQSSQLGAHKTQYLQPALFCLVSCVENNVWKEQTCFFTVFVVFLAMKIHNLKNKKKGYLYNTIQDSIQEIKRKKIKLQNISRTGDI